MPKSVLRYDVDKVKLFVPIYGLLFQCLCPELKFPNKSLSHELNNVFILFIIVVVVWTNRLPF